MPDFMMRGVEFAMLLAASATLIDVTNKRPFLWWAGRGWILMLMTIVLLGLTFSTTMRHPVTGPLWALFNG